MRMAWLGWLRSPGKYVGGPHHCQQDKAAVDAAAPRLAFLAAQSNLATSGSSLDYSPP